MFHHVKGIVPDHFTNVYTPAEATSRLKRKSTARPISQILNDLSELDDTSWVTVVNLFDKDVFD